MENHLKDALEIRDYAKKNNEMFKESIPLIASENVMSPLALEMLLTDFGHRYAEGLPHHRYYQGNYYVDLMEDKVNEIGKKLFNVPQIDPRPVSGTNANMAVIFALSRPGETVTAPDLSGGGHISAAKFGALGFRGLNIVNYPFNEDTMSIDPDGAMRVIREVKPKLALFGQSVFLFPIPLKEMRDAFQEVGCSVWYDAAHVIGLIAGKQFQDPLHEGADVMSGSTHKTLPGPQHGIILGNTDDETWKKIQRGVFPGVLSNHHLNTMAALGVTMAEMIDFGEEYARKTIENAQTLGQELHSLGVDVFGEKLGFTKSHTIVADIRKFGGGKKVAERLERCGIILNKNLIPVDKNKNSMDPSGIRIGAQEITRIGFGKDDVRTVAELIHRAISTETPDDVIRKDIIQFKSKFNEVKYCYGKEAPYDYITLFK
ncbi:MAG: serine hydroxymethyltransferase [Candidatus Thermoplasmatota archaeon]|jgi:glycine hydroxymethyltransferase|nr:serine hydroxymethyltransferase [Candidatus Thermoplasmatota archaeon]MCL5791048.1 serine hydroxymethyltransferase [Candidatus Thermoplasmatota archaeon]